MGDTVVSGQGAEEQNVKRENCLNLVKHRAMSLPSNTVEALWVLIATANIYGVLTVCQLLC